MSKAFKCDGCLELFEGDPAMKIDENTEICHNCVRTAEIFKKVDPFHSSLHEKTVPDNTLALGHGITIVPR